MSFLRNLLRAEAVDWISAAGRRSLRAFGDQIAERRAKLSIENCRSNVLRRRDGDVWKPWRCVQGDTEVRESTRAVRIRTGWAMGVAVPVSFPVRYPRRVPVFERVRERLERVARACSPGIRLVFELFAAVLLRMEERRGHQADDRDRGEEHRPVRAASRGHRREGRSAGRTMQAERTEAKGPDAKKGDPALVLPRYH
jgi:hypothetical protein